MPIRSLSSTLTHAPTKLVVHCSRRNRANCFILSDIGAEDSLLQRKYTRQRSANASASCGLSSSLGISSMGDGSSSERITKHFAGSTARPNQADASCNGDFRSPNTHSVWFINQVHHSTCPTSCRAPLRWRRQKISMMIYLFWHSPRRPTAEERGGTRVPTHRSRWSSTMLSNHNKQTTTVSRSGVVRIHIRYPGLL